MNKSKHKIILSILTLCLALVCTFCMPNQASAAKIKLSKKSVTITKGKSVTLKLKGTKKKPKWSTSNKKIATVSKKGKVVGKKAGNAKITAKLGKKKYVCKVKVTKAKPQSNPEPVPQPTPQPVPVDPMKPRYGVINRLQYCIVENKEVRILKYEGHDETLIIPATIENLPVTFIIEKAFMDCTSLVEVEIPDSVTFIGHAVFTGCANLKSVKLPLNLKKMDASAFSACTSLESVEIPNGIAILNSYTFSGCTNLSNVIIPESVTRIADNAFIDCPNLTIFGYADSKAERFAKDKNIPFKLIE